MRIDTPLSRLYTGAMSTALSDEAIASAKQLADLLGEQDEPEKRKKARPKRPAGTVSRDLPVTIEKGFKLKAFLKRHYAGINLNYWGLNPPASLPEPGCITFSILKMPAGYDIDGIMEEFVRARLCAATFAETLVFGSVYPNELRDHDAVASVHPTAIDRRGERSAYARSTSMMARQDSPTSPGIASCGTKA